MIGKKIGFGIIGTGQILETHIKAMRDIDEISIIGICSRYPERAALFSRKYGLRAYKDCNELFEDRDVEAVSIATSNFLHSELGILAAERGKHVLVEKPMATSIKDAERLISTCNKNKVKLGVIFQHRFDAKVKTLHREIQAKRFGEILFGVLIACWRRDDSYYSFNLERGKIDTAGGGVLIMQAIHYIDIFEYLLGPTKGVFGKIDTKTHNIEIEDIGVALLRFESGAFGTVCATTSLDKSMVQQIKIFGSKQTAVIEDKKDFLRARQLGRHQDVFKDFVDAIIKNREPQVNGEEGIRSLRIVSAIYESNREGREIYLK